MAAVKNTNNLEFDSNNFIYDMKVSVSLWLEDGGVYSFAHRSLQEYFAALFVKDVVEGSKKTIYTKLLVNFESERALTEIVNFLSLCEEMDPVYFYEYYYLPLTTELLNTIKRGDVKNQLRNYVLFFCDGIMIRPLVGRTKIRGERISPIINGKVYKSVYIHIDHTRELHRALTDASGDLFRVFCKTPDSEVLTFADTEGLLDSVVENLMDRDGVRLIGGFVKHLETEVKEKKKYIEDAVRTDLALIDMVSQ